MPKIKVPPLFEKTPPGKDFYWHVNRNWQIRVNIPNWLSSFGVSEEIEIQVDDKLYNIMDESMKKMDSIGILAHSALKHSAQYNNVKTLKEMIGRFGCMSDEKDIARTLGEFSLYRINSLFTVYNVEQEEENHKNRIYITSGKLGLPDKSYYSGEAAGIIGYSKLLEKVAGLLEVPYNMSVFVQLEASLADIIDKVEFDKDIRTTRQQLIDEYPHIPFTEFWETLGVLGDGAVVIGSSRWMHTMEKLFKTWTIENWKIYFTGSLILNVLPILPPPYSDLHYDFFEKKLKDQPEKMSQKRLALTMIKQWLPVTLSREYINLNFSANSKLKEEVTLFVRKLVDAAKNRLNNTEWLQPATRTRSKKKLDAMDICVAYPDEWLHIKTNKLNKENLLENILNLGKTMSLEDLEKEGKQSDKDKSWEDPAFAVNAYYYSQGNILIMPAGILNWPFYKADAPLGWNYGALGAAVGHEMTHAFDMEGKNYDERGYMEPWWTVGDNRAYNKKSKELVKIYSEANYMEHKVNGALTLSENIADLGGVGIALGALEEELVGASAESRKNALRNFFTAFAVSWRTKERKKKAYQALLIDRHAPPTLRVNLVVSQFDAWYEAFDIQEKSILFRPPEERVRIF